MTVTRRTLVGIALVAPLSFVGTAFAADPIKIGYQLPLTGNTAQYGQDFKTAAEIALDRFNASGKLPVKVEIVYEDSRSDAKEGVAIARKFVDDEKIVGVLGDFTSGVSMAAAQVYKEAGMPQLSQTASHPDYAKISEWQFRNITTQAGEGPYNADWMVSKGLKKVAVIAEQTDWGQSVTKYFSDELTAKGGTVVMTEYFNRGTPDFRSLLAKIERAKPDAIYTGFFYEDGANFLKQMKQLGYAVPVFSTSAAHNQKLIELAGPDAEGLSLTTNFLPNSPKPEVKSFVEAWVKARGAEPGQFPAQAFDAVNIMLDAIVKTYPKTTRASVRDALAATKDFPGVTGVTTFGPDREPVKQLSKVRVVGGVFSPVAE
ncbi:ABC transporter substrate-binding protein [Pinisolibacter aquiterrae]|uniref:ABC transporter substrate-binding protein n=1 Tax=Pinisolibacter aquiterrae TaxID=2815579 RepID=UPI001C3CFC3B|nr:ABC transporter substrate-binding protein [Pinisolibacter aquiterrae]MBV5265795.1 penicillin-binding protein activator [Pinisolibacter aquiterrae]MCC8236640.1 ABC transporter substrate-binding protein [Pinisolibacter aquiterrae]